MFIVARQPCFGNSPAFAGNAGGGLPADTKKPSIRFSLPLLPHLHDQAAEILEQSKTGQAVVLNALPASQAFKEAHFMIACSGTVTLEAGIAGVPGLVIYHLSLANRIFAKWFYKPRPLYCRILF